MFIIEQTVGLPMHALIIEDEYLTAQLIEDRLRQLGFTSFAFAMDEAEAVAAAADRCPDLITSDAELLSGCGIDAVQQICAEEPIPVLYITGSAATVRERCPWAIIIQKPFGLADLREAVEETRKDDLGPLATQCLPLKSELSGKASLKRT